MSERIPLYYTFGNHQHWVDLQWLWGYFVMPDSIKDQLHFCNETGAKGNINFDGIGYEKLAAEAPEAILAIKKALSEGRADVVGGSYGQPYGLFHGGESNCRQRIYGIRASMRVLGYRPRTFWEEEFDFFPQLPQMLRSVGIEYGSMFFQWTWHTPEVPKEDVPVVWWEGQDGSRLLTATRNRLNLHQWPEDVAILMDELAAAPPVEQGPAPLILQWLELMPTPDWMCRSEVLLPKTKELLSDPRFEFRFVTLEQYLRLSKESTNVPTRKYTMDDVWHGMSLGKNGDNAPRASHYAERCLLSAEALQSMLGLFGRPYDNWDVYPTWEFEECWRNLLAAQHHDNHECEGLCGHVAEPQYATVAMLTEEGHRGLDHLAKRVSRPKGSVLALNPFGWRRRVSVSSGDRVAVKELPAMGYSVITDEEFTVPTGKWHITDEGAAFERQGFSVSVDFRSLRATITRDGSTYDFPLPSMTWAKDGEQQVTGNLRQEIHEEEDPKPFLLLEPGGDVAMWLDVPAHVDALDITLSFEPTGWRQDPGLNSSGQAVWNLPHDWTCIRVDQPYSINEVHPNGEWPRKYPTGDWMTSPQWFETVKNPFTSQSFVDLTDASGSGVLIVHNGSQQWFQEGGTLRNVVALVDPWDEEKVEPRGRVTYRLIPHRGLKDAERWRQGREFFGLQEWTQSATVTAPAAEDHVGDAPKSFETAYCQAENVCITALYREIEDYSKRGLERYAGEGMGYPYVLRLVEFDGLETDTELVIAGTVAKAVKTNLMGEPEAELEVAPTDQQSRVSLSLRPFEIATVYLDIVEGRKQPRDLDAARHVWATVHRTEL